MIYLENWDSNFLIKIWFVRGKTEYSNGSIQKVSCNNEGGNRQKLTVLVIF